MDGFDMREWLEKDDGNYLKMASYMEKQASPEMKKLYEELNEAQAEWRKRIYGLMKRAEEKITASDLAYGLCQYQKLQRAQDRLFQHMVFSWFQKKTP